MNPARATLSAPAIRRRLRRFPRAFARYRRELARRYGKDMAWRLEQDARRGYATLLPSTPQFRGRLNLFNWVMGSTAVVVSLYAAAKANGMTTEQCAGVLYSATEDSLRSIPRWIRWLVRKLFFSRIFLGLARYSAARVRDHPEGWKIEYRGADGRTHDWSFECTECGVVKYLRRHGAAELAPYCNFVDYLQSRAFALGMQNPANIGQGSRACRQFYRQGRRTAPPDNLRAIVGPGRPAQERGPA